MRAFAFFTEDPAVRRATEADLRTARTFAAVRSPPGSQWLAAFCPDSPLAERPGAFFLEGAAELSKISTEELLSRCRYGDLQSLPGDFTFACFGARDEAFFVRSAAGAAPWFLWSDDASVAVASRLGDLLRFIPAEPRLDRLANAVLCGFWGVPPDGRTPFEGVRLLENGSATRVPGTRRRSGSIWWRPPVAERPKPGDVQARARALLDVLVGSLHAGTDADGANVVAVSGGLDSSILAWLSAFELKRDFATLTLVPNVARDLERVHSQTKTLFDAVGGRAVRRWEFEVSPAARVDYLRHCRPEAAYVGSPLLCVLEKVSREHPIRFYVGGEFCDQVLGGGPVARDWAATASIADALWRRPHYLDGRRGLQSWVAGRALWAIGRPRGSLASHPPPGFLAPEALADYAAQAKSDRAALASDRRPRAALAQQIRLAQPALVQNWEVASRLGIRRVFPFFNRRALDLAFSTHPLDLADRTNKSLVRTAAKLAVPQEVLRRPKVVWHDPPGLLAWNRRIPEELAGVVRPDWLDRPPEWVEPFDALRLQSTLNIIAAVRTIREARRQCKEKD